MSIEQINMSQAMALVPAIKLLCVMIIVVVCLWFATVAVCAALEKVKSKILIKGAR